jgi:hypothetical protein
MENERPSSTVSHGALRRSRKQLQAEEVARVALIQKRWSAAVPKASTLWSRLSPDELRLSRGNVHKLAGLIQLRYGTTREDSDSQVAAFMKDNLGDS